MCLIQPSGHVLNEGVWSLTRPLNRVGIVEKFEHTINQLLFARDWLLAHGVLLGPTLSSVSVAPPTAHLDWNGGG
jgi:hypothetical protein